MCGSKPGAETPAATPVAEGRESELQRQCETVLRSRGYLPRTPTAIATGRPPAGWFLHLVEAPRNPLALDLVILGVDGRWLEVELKTPRGRVRQHQRQLAEAAPGQCVIVRSAGEFAAVLDAWRFGL